MKRFLLPAIILLFSIASCKKNTGANSRPVLTFTNISDTVITTRDSSQQIAIELRYTIPTKGIEGQPLSFDLQAYDVRDTSTNQSPVNIQEPFEISNYTVPENKISVTGDMTVILDGFDFPLRPSRPGGDTSKLRMTLSANGGISDTVVIPDIYILPQ